jgi:hypothetical protein
MGKGSGESEDGEDGGAGIDKKGKEFGVEWKKEERPEEKEER